MKHQLLKLTITASLCIGLAHAEVVVVNSVGDQPAVDPSVSALTASATITLRSAIERTNFNGGTNTINFAIGGTGPFIITPASFYPIITNNLTIDGYSQKGSKVNTLRPDVGSGGINAVIMIEIQGQNILNQFGQPLFGSVCFTTTANSCVFKGLAINQFFGDAIDVIASDVLVSGCFLGTDASGTQAPGGPFKLLQGISIFGQSGRVGGTDPADRNLILGDQQGAVVAGSSGSGLFQIMGNLFNTEKTGTSLLSASEEALLLATRTVASSTFIVGGADPRGRNLISGAVNGIRLVLARTTPAGTYFIENNYIGTDITGSHAIPNTIGIIQFPGVGLGSDVHILKNLISGNRAYGIYINQRNNPLFITGNTIGLTANGNSPLGNGKDGIALFDTEAITIGDGTEEGANIIAGNGRHGIWVGANARYAEVRGNYIGTNRQGMPLGNGRNGIRVGGDIQPALDITIGGCANGDRNIIAHNGNHGIHIRQNSTKTKVLNNHIENNQVNGVRDTNVSRQTLIQGNQISGGLKGVVIGQNPNDLSQAAIVSNSIVS